MLRQLAPLVRFDGYHVLADVTGVPDLYHRIKPTLLGLLPGRWKSPEASVLKPWARAVVTTWVLVVVPVLLGTLVLMVLALPRLIGTAVASLGDQADLLGEQLGDGDVLGVMVRLLSIVAIALPVLGALYIIARTVRQVATRTWRATEGRPGRRALAGAAALAVVAGLAWAWWPEPGAYRPIQAYERGVVQDALPTSLRSATPTGLVEGRAGQGPDDVARRRRAAERRDAPSWRWCSCRARPVTARLPGPRGADRADVGVPLQQAAAPR